MCAKCGNQVTADTNLLLLSDGSPVCENCSYCCSICKLPILDEAIMAGDDSYHAHCFKCKVCKNRIDELMFAKTSQGIYCMDCHSERVARSRRHAQRQREREEEKERERAREKAGAVAGTVDGGSASSREDAAKAREVIGAPARLSPPLDHHSCPDSPRPLSHAHSRADPNGIHHRPGPIRATKSAPSAHRASSIPDRGDGVHGGSDHVPRQPSVPVSSIPSISATPSSPPQPERSTPLPDTGSLTVSICQPKAIPASNSSSRKNSFSENVRSHSPVPRMDSLGVPSSGAEKSLLTRKSFDGSVRPSNLQLRPSHSSHSLKAAASMSRASPNSRGLSLPDRDQARRDKRSSINPAVARSFANAQTQPSSSSSSTAPAVSSTHGRDFPRSTSTLHEHTSAEQTAPAYSLSVPPAPATSNLNPQLLGRARSGSSGSPLSENKQQLNQAVHSLSRPGSGLDHLPSRPGSHSEQQARLAAGDTTRSHDAGPSFGDGRRKDERRPPSLHLADGDVARAQESSVDRPQASPTPSVHTLRNSRSSSGTIGMELELPPASSSPMSPSHHVDVPHGIESGTDTESEESRDMEEPNVDALPPALPPKGLPHRGSIARPPPLRLDTMDINRNSSDAGHTDSGEGIVESPESSPVERTSHATFIAPALPPIRISMGGTDFSDLLKSVGGNVLKLDQLKEANEDGSVNSISRSPSILPSPSSIFASTPTSDGMMKSPDTDETPVKRVEPIRNGLSRQPSLAHERSGSPTPSLAKDRAFPKLSTNVDSVGMGTDSRPQSPRVLEDRRALAEGPSSTQSGHLDGRRSLDVKSRPRKISTHSSRTATLESRDAAHITVTSPDNMTSKLLRADSASVVKRQLQDVLATAASRKETHVTLPVDLVQTMIALLEQRAEEYNDLRQKLDGAKRASKQYIDGLTVAQTEYDRELKARRDAEAEVTRLRVLLSGQAVRLSAISGESKRHEAQKQLSRELSDNLSTLEKSLSQLKVERDMTLAEVEQLSASRSSTTVVGAEDGSPASMTRALSMRFDNIKTQYKLELLPLTEQREALTRELAELKASRDAFLEETTMLNARNEELAQLNSQYVRRLEAAGIDYAKPGHAPQDSIDNTKPKIVPDFSASVSSLTEESSESRFVKISKPDITESPQVKPTRFIKWPGSKTPKDNVAVAWPDPHKPKGRKEHVFQQISVLRVGRCDHCGDKMWGSQLRCSSCNIAVHTRCIHQVAPCSQQRVAREDNAAPLHPSIFGRDLIEQVRFDSREDPRSIPVIVEKCIDAVDALALDYEGIYRKTGGSGQSKIITQLFDSANYRSFDLRNTEKFNDICSVTSVLKSYFRALPDPLLTYALHDEFIAASNIKDPSVKSEALAKLVHKLPKEHYHTTRALMLHLHRISERSDQNLMHARNLGVVFGPTLMRSRDPNAEFVDMAGKALSVEWLIENAPMVFEHSGPTQ
ncbi:hypothetical protein BKA93DRAFT_237913 [Sparassis latifolia]